jgi:hypothetical protein
MVVIEPKYVGAVLNVNFNVNFKIVFKTIQLCISWWIKNFDNVKMHGMYVKTTSNRLQFPCLLREARKW